MDGRGCSPARSLVVWTGARLAVVWATSAWVSKVPGAALVALGSLRVVLAALRQKEQRVKDCKCQLQNQQTYSIPD